jgi:hypothetical protein
MEIIQSFADRLRFLIVDPEGIDGCSPKTNLGVDRASAPHIAWLCQDDFWLAGRVAAIRRWIGAHPTAVLHLAPTAIVDREDRVHGIWRCPLTLKDLPVEPEMLFERLLVQNFVGVPSPIIRRDAWIACGGLDLDLWYTGDWDIWLKLARLGAVIHHNDVTAAFRIHDSSATSAGSREREDFEAQHRIVVERHIAAIAPERRETVRRLAETSITVNVALAAAAHGEGRAILHALSSIAALGPVDASRYFHRSRIADRVLPRLRAKSAGVF